MILSRIHPRSGPEKRGRPCTFHKAFSETAKMYIRVKAPHPSSIAFSRGKIISCLKHIRGDDIFVGNASFADGKDPTSFLHLLHHKNGVPSYWCCGRQCCHYCCHGHLLRNPNMVGDIRVYKFSLAQPFTISSSPNFEAGSNPFDPSTYQLDQLPLPPAKSSRCSNLFLFCFPSFRSSSPHRRLRVLLTPPTSNR